MKKQIMIGLIVSSLALTIALSPCYSAAEQLIIQTQNSNSWDLGYWDDDDYIAQSFTTTGAQTNITSVWLYLSDDASNGDTYCAISPTRSMESGDRIGIGYVENSDISSTPSWVEFTMLSDCPVSSSTSYYLIVACDTYLNNAKIWGSTSNPYSGGTLWTADNDVWSQVSGSDLAFRIYGNTLNTNPIADFSYSTDGLTVDVDGSLSFDPDGTIVSYQWDWTSDGSYDDTGITASYTYPSANTYSVTLRVVDDDGDADTHTESITVTSGGSGNQAPTASFVVTSTSGLTVYVNGGGSSDPDGTITTYAWDWTNDGIYDDSGASATASHTYTTGDTYTIKLRVTDNGSATDTYTRSVTVPSGSGSSGFTSTNNTMYYLLAGVAAAVVIALVIYYGPTRKGKRNVKRPRG